LILGLTVAVAAGSPSGCSAPDQASPDAAKAREVVTSYLEAVEAGDAEAVASLVTPGNEASLEVADRMARFGRRAAANADVDYVDDFGGQVMHVTITDPAASGGAARETLQLVAEDGQWYAALGQARQARPGASSVEPP
jgi:ketosteroid isomerase-like protein